MSGYEIIDIPQGTPEWKEYRNKRIGASDLAAICGVCPWKTPRVLWEDKVFGKERHTNAAMLKGHVEEPRARAYVNQLLACNYQPKVLQSSEYPFLMASLDGLDLSQSIPVLEIKTPSQQSRHEIPNHYLYQLQGQMIVSGSPKAYYCEWNADEGKARLWVVEANHSLQQEILTKVFAFRKSIIDLVPPDADEVIIEDQELLGKSERLLELDRLFDEIEEERSAIRASMIDKCKDHPVSRVGSYRVTQCIRKGAIQYDKIEALKKIDLEAYRKAPSTYWRVA